MTNKKNTILFIIVGTIVQVLLILLLLAVFITLTAVVFKNDNDNMAAALMIASILCSYFLGALLYQKLATWVITKWHLEDKLDPLFSKRTMKKNRYDNQF
ncbi:MAG: leader peptide processing enzyme [Treponema sp.]|nr:leader peptide processing enzyme [Candidatus Treponema caballi]